MIDIKRRRHLYGFSLPEVLLAVLFISIAFFAFAALQQRLIFSSWKVEARNEPRESSRSALIKAQAYIRDGIKPSIDDNGNSQQQDNTADDNGEEAKVSFEYAPGVDKGLYHVHSQRSWIDKSASRAGGEIGEQVYIFDTYAVQKRTSGWKPY